MSCSFLALALLVLGCCSDDSLDLRVGTLLVEVPDGWLDQMVFSASDEGDVGSMTAACPPPV